MVTKRRLPRDSMEEWLAKQKVRPTGRKPEVRIPPDTFEAWLERQMGLSRRKK